MSATDPRRQPDLYWKEMEELKAAAVCMRLCRNRLARRVRAVDLLKAIASSDGIAGWVVWKDYPFLWTAIIAAAQLLDAIKGVFPFARDHKAASELTVALELLFIDTQYEWERIHAGRITEDGVMVALRKLRRLMLEAEQKQFPDGFQPPARLTRLAAKEAEVFFDETYRAVKRVDKG
jgi:hypothetical protein